MMVWEELAIEAEAGKELSSWHVRAARALRGKFHLAWGGGCGLATAACGNRRLGRSLARSFAAFAIRPPLRLIFTTSFLPSFPPSSLPPFLSIPQFQTKMRLRSAGCGRQRERVPLARSLCSFSPPAPARLSRSVPPFLPPDNFGPKSSFLSIPL